MTSKILAVVVALALTVGTIPVANAAKPMHHHAAHPSKGCKAEFMYMKGGKCMDARDKATRA